MLKLINLSSLILVSGLVSGCGVKLSGDVNVHHIISVDIGSLEDYFKAYCDEAFTNPADAANCVTNQVQAFLAIIEGTKPPAPLPTNL